MADRPPVPKWSLPPDLAEQLAQDGFWEDETWEPLALSVLADTEYHGRLIERSWQIAFHAFDPRIRHWTTLLEAAGLTPDGDGWTDIARRHIGKLHPELPPRLHDDSEGATCVIWVESEADARVLIETLWQLLTDPEPSLAKIG